ncbi:MAG: NupC/NupG family nucleoside CNT transporter [Lentisphaeria bacterium]|nr:NupC/NupG family nucleoside CNT transporter [Lentisphaeria bacterium]
MFIKEKIVSVVGLLVFIAVAWLCSTNRRKIDWRLVLNGTVIQLVFALLILKTSVRQSVFTFLDGVVMKLLEQSKAGAEFLFSKVLTDPETASKVLGTGFIFAFQMLPVIIFVSAVTAILYYCGVLQKIVLVLAIIMKRTLRISGAEACSAAANIFIGQIEAPLIVKPYIKDMTNSEIACLMTGGLATISGSSLGGCAKMLGANIDGIAGHLIAASIMSAPAAIVFSKILVPEEGTPVTLGKFKMNDTRIDSNVVDACARGCSEGLKVALDIAAMLIGFISVIAMLQWIWNGAVGMCGLGEAWHLQNVIGWLFSPFAYLLGIPATDMVVGGQLISEKTFLNEMVAYSHLSQLLDGTLTSRSAVILSYALCGFANFGSIGMLIAGFGGMAPNRRGDVSRLAMRTLLGGTFASFSTAIIAGLFL